MYMAQKPLYRTGNAGRTLLKNDEGKKQNCT